MFNLFRSIERFLRNQYRKARYLYWLFLSKDKGKLPPLIHPIILFILPEAGINLYLKTLVSIASQLKIQGYQVVFARCFHMLERCMFMDSEGMAIDATTNEKKILCTYCLRNFDTHVIKNQFDFVDLRHFAFEEDKKEIQAHISRHASRAFPFAFEGINFSEMLEYNLFLYLKKSDINSLSFSEVKLWQQHLTSLYIGYKATKRLIQNYGISHIIMSEQYSFNFVIQALSKNVGAQLVNVTMPFHKDVDISKIRVMQKDPFLELYDASKEWPQFKDLALSPYLIKEIVDDLIIRMLKSGTYTYSPQKSNDSDLIEKMNLSKLKKTIIAYPSSPDEAEAVINSHSKLGIKLDIAEDPFSNQFDWLNELIEFVEKSNEYQLIIRLHPRMAPNHREKWGCSEVDKFKGYYSKNYNNVRIVWPEDKISSFDLAEIADVVTVSWSSMGNFMSRLGIPVVTGLRSFLPALQSELYSCNKTKQDFFKNLQLMSQKLPSMSELKEVYRWYHLFYLSYTIDLGDIIEEDERKLDKLSKNAILLKNALVDNQSVLKMTLNTLKNGQTTISDFEESTILRKQLFRLIHFFMTNKDDFKNEEFPISNDGHQTFENNLITHGNEVVYYYQGIKYAKYSPLVVRIAMIISKFNKSRINNENRNKRDEHLHCHYYG